ncbi:hypothetical protein [Streptomyces sp. NPDC049906]|uniref:hypothetical protein n=1 Tax=Streptomyces sp. NPDC049906 TaxID=3155656 RepID=UPI00342A6A60
MGIDTGPGPRARSRGARAYGPLSLAAVLLLPACSGPGADDDRSPARPSLAAVGAVVAGAAALDWSGSWRQYHRNPDGTTADDPWSTVTAELRSLGNGDVFGTMSANGRTAQVMLVSGTTLFTKADRAMLHTMGVENPGADAGRWREVRRPDGSHEVLGLRLDRLAPAALGAALAPSKASGTGKDTTGPSPMPSSAAGRFRRPAGVPTDAVAVPVRGDGTTRGGTYWLSADSPHRLLGYSGLGFRHDSQAGPHETMSDAAAAALTVRAEDTASARAGYAGMRSALRALPATVPVSTTPTGAQLSETTDEECGVRCHTVVVAVALTNRMPKESVTASYRLALTGAKRMDGGRLLLDNLVHEELGSCTVRLPAARPGATVRGACTVSGAALRKAVDAALDRHGFLHLDFKTEATRRIDRITGPSRAEDLLEGLVSGSADALGAG